MKRRTEQANTEYLECGLPEYLSAVLEKLYEIVGISVQEPLLGIYRIGGKEKIVCACKDFSSPGVSLNDFASQKNTVIDSPHGGYSTEFSSVIDAIESIDCEEYKEILNRFWDMFVVDALIGNGITATGGCCCRLLLIL